VNLWKKIKNALWAILGLLAAIFLFLRQKKPPNTEKAEQVIDESKKTVGEIVKNKAEREKQAADLKDKLKKITTGTLILVFLICVPVMAQDIEIYIPKDYDELVEYYKAVAEVAIEYQRLYEAAEADVGRLLEENARLSEQLEIMIQYTRKPKIGLTAGAIVSAQPGIFVGLTLQL
jgi:hypothetical protein